MRRTFAAVAVLCLVLTACGMKVPVTVVAGDDGELVADDGPVGSTGDTASGRDDRAGGPALGGSGRVPGSVGDGASRAGSLFENETQGVTNDSLTVCAHVPITGAAPIPHDPARFGQFYFNYVNEELGGVYGRKVRYIALDDGYNPAGARAAAEKCYQQGAFLYLGAAGTDQIVSVAKWAERKQVPYYHGPTSDKDLHGLRYNAHAGPTYEYQHRLLARYLVKRFTKNVNYGMVRVNSPYFDAGHDAFVEELRKLGVTLAVDRVVQKDENTFSDIFYELSRKNVQVVNNFTTPSLWLKMLNQKGNYDPWWTAVSPVAGFNIVAQALTGSGKAVVFHHFNPACFCTDYQKDLPSNLPWTADIKRFLEIFRRYSPQQKPDPDDFDYSAYLAARSLHRLLLKVGPQPTRSKMWALTKTYRETRDVAFPGCGSDFTRSLERKGAWHVNVFNLEVGKWKQIRTCVDSV